MCGPEYPGSLAWEMPDVKRSRRAYFPVDTGRGWPRLEGRFGYTGSPREAKRPVLDRCAASRSAWWLREEEGSPCPPPKANSIMRGKATVGNGLSQLGCG